jgi:hypothetical protein
LFEEKGKTSCFGELDDERGSWAFLLVGASLLMWMPLSITTEKLGL